MAAKDKPFLLVTVGTTDFDALVRTMDGGDYLDDYRGLFQIGAGRHEPKRLPFIRFAHSLDPYYDQADVVVAHGGLAVTMEVLRRGIPLVSIANDDRRDNHQDDLLSELEAADLLVWARTLDDVGQALKEASTRQFARYEDPQCEIHEHIHRFLD